MARPYDVYMKTLYALVKDRLEGDDEREILWDDEITSRLADFQKAAVRQALQFLGVSGGVFVADVVGLGKSYIGAAIVKHMERTQHARPLIICPAQLVPMWSRYNEAYHLNAQVLSMGLLNEGSAAQFLDLDKGLYKERNFVLVDESHNFRYPDTQRYKFLQSFLATGRRCCFLTATPRNKSAWDVYHQIKLFHQEEKTDLPIDPPDLKAYFKLIEERKRKLQDLLRNLMVRRTRKDILRFYGLDAETHQKVDPSRWRDYVEGKRKAYVQVAGKHQFFPKRELETIEYSIEETYQGLYQEMRGYLGKKRRTQTSKPPAGELTFARYGLWHYVDPAKQRHEPYASLHRVKNPNSSILHPFVWAALNQASTLSSKLWGGCCGFMRFSARPSNRVSFPQGRKLRPSCTRRITRKKPKSWTSCGTWPSATLPPISTWKAAR